MSGLPKTSATPSDPVTAGEVTYKKSADNHDIVDTGYSVNMRNVDGDTTCALWCPATHNPVRVELCYTAREDMPKSTPGVGITKVCVGPAQYVKPALNSEPIRAFNEKAATEIPLSQPTRTLSARGFPSDGYTVITYELPVGIRGDLSLIAQLR